MRHVDSALRGLRRSAWLKSAYAVLLLASAIVAAQAPRGAAAARDAQAIEWPSQWDGRALRPLALGDVEQRFAARFPGDRKSVV